MSKSVESEALPQKVKRFYERISVERDAALEELPKLYSDDVRFINPVVDERGLSTFTEYWKKALRQYKTFEFKNVEVTGTDEKIDGLLEILRPFGLMEVARTGQLAMTRGNTTRAAAAQPAHAAEPVDATVSFSV